MKITVILAGALLCVLFIPAAYARPLHHIVDITKMVGCSDPVMRPCNPGRAASSRRFQASADREKLQVRHKTRQVMARTLPIGLQRLMAEGAGRVVAPARYIRGRLRCALNVGAALAARGIRGTGSALAKSYLRWGHASGPVPGAVAVFSRRDGGHVAIVDHVRPDGTVIYLNPSSRRQAWQVGPYRRKPIAYRVAGGW